MGIMTDDLGGREPGRGSGGLAALPSWSTACPDAGPLECTVLGVDSQGPLY